MTNDKLEELYKQYRRMVKDTAYKIIKDYDLAEDVCHDVFLKLSDRWVEANVPRKTRENYLRVVTLHKAIDYLHKTERHYDLIEYNTTILKNKVMFGEEDIFYGIRDEFVCSMLYHLKEKNENWYMAILKSKVYHEPVNLIASDMGVSSAAVRIWIHRGKYWLQSQYGESVRLRNK